MPQKSHSYLLKHDPKKKPKFHKNLRIQISEISAYPKNLALFIGFALHGYVTLTLVVHDLFWLYALHLPFSSVPVLIQDEDH